jgi:hypothetical protein
MPSGGQGVSMLGLHMAGPLSAQQAESMNADNEYWEHLMPRLRDRPLAMLGHLRGTEIGIPWEKVAGKGALSEVKAHGVYNPGLKEVYINPNVFITDQKGKSNYDDVMLHELEHSGHDEIRGPTEHYKSLWSRAFEKYDSARKEHDRIYQFEVDDPEASDDHLVNSFWNMVRPSNPWTKESLDEVAKDRGEWETRAMDEISKLLKLRE